MAQGLLKPKSGKARAAAEARFPAAALEALHSDDDEELE